MYTPNARTSSSLPRLISTGGDDDLREPERTHARIGQNQRRNTSAGTSRKTCVYRVRMYIRNICPAMASAHEPANHMFSQSFISWRLYWADLHVRQHRRLPFHISKKPVPQCSPPPREVAIRITRTKTWSVKLGIHSGMESFLALHDWGCTSVSRGIWCHIVMAFVVTSARCL